MATDLKEFGGIAKGLAKNPLGIIALFIVLIYGFASLVVGFSGHLESGERTPIIWFLVLFPVVVIGVFGWLVSSHHHKLYAPADFKNEDNFLSAHSKSLQELTFAAPNPVCDSTSGDRSNDDLNTSGGRAKERNEIYANSRGYFIAHVVEPSARQGQEFDIFIYLIRHKSEDYGDIAKAEFFFGHYWGNMIFEGKRVGNLIGVKTSAYGPFLCTCRVTFKDGTSITLHRYIDFEMGKFV